MHSFQAMLLDLLAPLGPIQSRRMFSGTGLFLDGLMFSIVLDDQLYLKGDEANRPLFASEDMQPFRYDRQGKSAILHYYRVPDGIYDEPDDLVRLAVTAVAAARRGHTTKSVKRPRKTTTGTDVARKTVTAKAGAGKGVTEKAPGRRTKSARAQQ